MDIKFRIIWFEDIDEWFNTLSRRVSRYIKNKNFEVDIKRIRRADEFSINDPEIINYDLMIIDYELGKVEDMDESPLVYGSDIINQIRQGKFVNDILFYSSHGYEKISNVMRNLNLQGVFIADRDNNEFYETIQRLIDKSIRRAENIVNIRGIVMDATSDFDNKIKDLISILWNHLGEKETKISEDIKKKILLDNKKSAEKLFNKYEVIDHDNIDALLQERDFNAYRQARLLGWCIEANEMIKFQLHKILEKSIDNYNVEQGFFERYTIDVINYRNALAHVKNSPIQNGNCYIGEVNGEQVIFNKDLCEKLRKTIIQYNNVLDEMYKYIEDNC